MNQYRKTRARPCSYNGGPITGEVLEEIEKDFDFSASVKVQKRVIEGWIWPPVFHREPSHTYPVQAATF